MPDKIQLINDICIITAYMVVNKVLDSYSYASNNSMFFLKRHVEMQASLDGFIIEKMWNLFCFFLKVADLQISIKCL